MEASNGTELGLDSRKIILTDDVNVLDKKTYKIIHVSDSRLSNTLDYRLNSNIKSWNRDLLTLARCLQFDYLITNKSMDGNLLPPYLWDENKLNCPYISKPERRPVHPDNWIRNLINLVNICGAKTVSLTVNEDDRSRISILPFYKDLAFDGASRLLHIYVNQSVEIINLPLPGRSRYYSNHNPVHPSYTTCDSQSGFYRIIRNRNNS